MNGPFELHPRLAADTYSATLRSTSLQDLAERNSGG